MAMVGLYEIKTTNCADVKHFKLVDRLTIHTVRNTSPHGLQFHIQRWQFSAHQMGAKVLIGQVALPLNEISGLRRRMETILKIKQKHILISNNNNGT